ncbi:MAG TPA: haloacid dehalogenase type II [Stellaceae bacterium]|nr:haloacid dehalogenase type II [Stellaceae bacterium]
MKFSEFRVLEFDCYGTLIDWETGILEVLRPWARASGRTISDGEILRAFAEAEARAEAMMPSERYPRVLAATYHALGRKLDLPTTEADAQAFGASAGNWPAFPDTASSLRYLKQHHQLVVLSNVDRATFARTSEQFGVEFDRVITAEEIGSYKPDLRNFEYAIRTIAKMSVTPDRILHISESLFHDIGPAKTLGLRAVWINRRVDRSGAGPTLPKPGATPDLVVSSLAEFVELHRAQQSAS